MLPQIFVKTLKNNTITLEVNLNMTTNDFKKLVFKKLGEKPYPHCRFVFTGKHLNDGYTLNDFNIKNECTIHMTVPLCDSTFNKKCLPGNESLLDEM
jgi:ubiquitin C